MKLRVIKAFNGKVEGKTLSPGETITTDDVERINALVGRGFCVIVSLNADAPVADVPTAENKDEDGNAPTIEIGGVPYGVEMVKAAIKDVGGDVSPNAKEKGVLSAIAKLTEAQAKQLYDILTTNS